MSSYLNEVQRGVVTQWWRALQPQHGIKTPPFFFDRGHKARLRRAPQLAHVLLEDSIFQLREHLGTMGKLTLERNDQVWLPLLAGTLAHVESHITAPEPEGRAVSGQSLARRLNLAAAKSGSKAPMSALRFRRMMSSSDPEDFFLQLRRALRLVSGPVDVVVLAEDLLAWYAEHDLLTQPAYAMRFRWARDYYLRPKDLPPVGATTHTPVSESTEESSAA
jgi:CRISPR type I-E-associated protein CasB/Cse2